MSHVASGERARALAHRPTPVNVTLGILLFLGVTALGGGLEMVVFPQGNQYLPIDLIDSVPIVDSFLIPGVVLGGVFGLGSLFVAWGVWRRPRLSLLRTLEDRTAHHWSWTALVAIGAGFALWMGVEMMLLGAPWEARDAADAAITWTLYSMYCTVAASLLIVPHLDSVKRHLAR